MNGYTDNWTGNTGIEKPEGSKVLVLSPHPDDDIFGCGGTLYKHSSYCDELTTVYMTDGRKGCPSSMSEEDTVRERRKEAKEAAKIIGIQNITFLNNKDKELRLSRKSLSEMIDILKKITPDIVYLPFLTDNHPDHFETNKIFISACKKLKTEYTVCAYEVHTPLIPTHIVDISSQFEKKIHALRQHKTQLLGLDFTTAVKGLNKYRASMSNIDGYAEAFFLSNSSFYMRLIG